MLVTDVGGLREIVPHGRVGYVCKPNSISVANSLVDFFDKDKESIFIKHLKEEKLKYSWEKMIQDIKLLHRDLL